MLQGQALSRSVAGHVFCGRVTSCIQRQTERSAKVRARGVPWFYLFERILTMCNVSVCCSLYAAGTCGIFPDLLSGSNIPVFLWALGPTTLKILGRICAGTKRGEIGVGRQIDRKGHLTHEWDLVGLAQEHCHAGESQASLRDPIIPGKAI